MVGTILAAICSLLVHTEDNRAFDIFLTRDSLAVLRDRQSSEVLLCRNYQSTFRKILNTSLKLAGRSFGVTSSWQTEDGYICGLEKRNHVFV
jgi:sulfur relay (sulfurtransferase) DsrF/TusC family protein